MHTAISKFRSSTRGVTCSLLVLLALSGASLCIVRPVAAAPGDLDQSFGTGGKVVTRDGACSQASALAIQYNDGKLVVAVDFWCLSPKTFALRRYNPNGIVDSSFGTGGKVTTDFGGSSSAYALAIQADGKLVAAGGALNDFALARYNSDGSLDSGFGTGGKVTTDFGGSSGATALAIQADGKLVAAGVAGDDFALARYNPNGSLDPNFGIGGKVTTDFGGSDRANALAIQADGKLVTAGVAGDHFALARYNPDGSLDSNFGTGGKVTTDFGDSNGVGARDLAIQADGKLVVVGTKVVGFLGNDFALARFNADGTLDSSFGTGGKVITSHFPNFFADGEGASALAIQLDGKLVAAGFATSDIGLARYTGADLVVVNDLVHLNSLKFSFTDPASDAPPEAKAGSMIIDPALFSNGSGFDICNPFFEIAELSGGNRLLGVFAEDPNPLVGSIQIQGLNGAFLAHVPVVLGVGETMPFELIIGLQTRQRFNFVVNMRGSPAPQGSCP